MTTASYQLPTAASVFGFAFAALAQQIAAAATSASDDATALLQLACCLDDGNYYGRYQLAPTPTYLPAAQAGLAALTVQAVAWRGLVAQFAAQAESDSEDLASFIADLLALPEAVRLACAAPADALRLLTQLAKFQPSPFAAGTDAEGLHITALAISAAALFRRAAGISLARASADYQPTSQQDAEAVRDNVAGVLDCLEVEAGDRFEDASFAALDALRVAVVNDLTQRGASLAPVVTRNFAVNLPAAVMAWRLYSDATRADDLVTRNNPPHPAFMPTTVEALAV